MAWARTLLVNAGLVFAALALALGLGEAAVRILGTDYATQGFYQRSRTRSYELKPSARFTSPLGVPNRVNSLGLPSQEIPPKAPGELRVLVLGDSCTHNIDVPYARRFTSLLGPRLSQALGRPVRVVNAGVTGYNIRQIMTLYREVGRGLKPDCVVLHYVLTDSYRRSLVNRTFLQLPDWLQDTMLTVYDASALVRWVRAKLQALATNNHLNELGDMDSFLTSEAWTQTRTSILGLKAELASRGTPLVVLVYTYLNDVSAFTPYYQAVEAFCRKHDIPVASTWQTLEKRPGDLRDLWVSPGDAHPNAEANAVMTEALEPVLLDALRGL